MTAALCDRMPEPLEFREGGPAGASIWLSPDCIASMIEAAANAGRKETGGILIGRYGPDGWNADILEATPKPKGSRSGWFWFQRSNNGLAELLAERWRVGQHYLGEWHFHPGGAPTPSAPDIRAMQKVASEDAYRCPSPILVIIGGRPPKSYAISATLFRDGMSIELKNQVRR
ncbi:Mov34/MPN/PAD-1 family protein [Sphingomonas sp. Leaf198]|uniref:Mov34/MPN/PAD-1 family protein n=1 Tax=Sphingomonas sp. Leaf198 TaxID=1736299 RepID=UPI0009ECC141|nr:Mov34/MPN/PAD-1 family protein [Sphingomonas sp. Leaf198]